MRTEKTQHLSRTTIRELLEKWRAGLLTEQDVFEQAEEIWDSHEWPNFPEEDPRSIAIEVVAELSVLYFQLITQEDIPAMITFLNTEPGGELKAWERWRDYWSQIDFQKRKRALRDNPYYSTEGRP